MPRDSVGFYRLPAGNPVAPNTIIETNWANPTCDDIAAALTDSLSRSGLGGMSAPMKFADGLMSAPGISWVNEPASGFYRKSPTNFWYAINGVDIFGITPAGLILSPGLSSTNFAAAITIADAEPTMKEGAEWYESDTGYLYMKYRNPDSTFTLVGINTPSLKGDKGDVGAKGDKGDTGPAGPQGIQGNQGVQGPVGPAGPVGADSTVPGPPGAQGNQGVPGVAGPPGPQGPVGPAGADGTGAVLTQDAEPTSAIDGNQWYESDTGNLYMKYQNPDGTFTWIHTNAGQTGQAGPTSSVNAIINGDMMIWQRGTSFSPMTGGAYSADRWQYVNTSAATHYVARHLSAPTVAQAGRLFNYSLVTQCLTADTSIAPGDVTVLAQHIEGYNWVPCAQRACTLSFWVVATKPGVYCVSFTNINGDRSFVAEYTVNASIVWEFKVIAIPPSPSAGTWNYTNGTGASLRFALAAGTNWQGTAGWQTGNLVATANQVNAADTVGNTLYITGVDLRPGTFTAPQFVSRSFGEELALCQRYYEKSYNLDVAPGTNTTAGYKLYRVSTNGAEYETILFKVAKRAAPNIGGYTPAGVPGMWRNEITGVDMTFQLAAVAGETAFTSAIDTPVAGHVITGHWVADAEL